MLFLPDSKLGRRHNIHNESTHDEHPHQQHDPEADIGFPHLPSLRIHSLPIGYYTYIQFVNISETSDPSLIK